MIVASAEIYDPVTGSLQPDRRDGDRSRVHTATLLLDGRVLMAGGSEVIRLRRDSTTRATGTFSRTGTMAVQHFSHTATLLADGRVLMAGGSEVFASAEIYDPTTGAFSSTKL